MDKEIPTLYFQNDNESRLMEQDHDDRKVLVEGKQYILMSDRVHEGDVKTGFEGHLQYIEKNFKRRDPRKYSTFYLHG